jgi:hypothetical protein
MTDNGETATTNASGISVVSRELQLAVTRCIFAFTWPKFAERVANS